MRARASYIQVLICASESGSWMARDSFLAQTGSKAISIGEAVQVLCVTLCRLPLCGPPGGPLSWTPSEEGMMRE